MLETTLNKIKAYNPCKNGWEKLLTFLGKTEADDEPLPLLTILESNGIHNALWALRAVEGMDGPIRLFACACARYNLGIFESEYPDDDRPRRAIETAERFARGQVGEEELVQAETAAWISWVGTAAETAARTAAWDVAAWAASRAVARAAAGAAARAAAWKVGAEVEITWAAFTEEFKRLCILGENYEHS